MAKLDQPPPAKDASPSAIKSQPGAYEPDPGEFINSQKSMQTSLYESQSLVHDGKLPEFELLESQVNQEAKGTGTRTGAIGNETYSVTLVDGKRVTAGISRQDGSSDVARYNADGSVDENILTGQTAIHRHYASAGDGGLQSEEHEIKFDSLDTGVRYADHIEYDQKGQIVASDIVSVDPFTNQRTFTDEIRNADGSGSGVGRSPDVRTDWQTKSDGSSIVHTVPTEGDATVQALDPSSNILYIDTIDRTTGKIVHAVPQADGTVKVTEQRAT